MTGTLNASLETKPEQDSEIRRLKGTRLTVAAVLRRHLRGARFVPRCSHSTTLLRKSVYPDLRRLEAIENEDEIILTGVVRSYHMKQMAQETVHSAIAGRRLQNKVVVSPATAAATRSVAPLRIVIATGNADLSNGCAERLRALGHVVECIGSGLDLMAALRSRLPDMLVVADPLPWGGADGVVTRVGELGLLPRVKVILVCRPDPTVCLPVELRGQLAAAIVGDDSIADLVARAIERVLAD
jgi:hypothetical protein